MARRLFCSFCPAAYRLSVWKERCLRRIADGLSRHRLARERQDVLLPVVICTHKSLIRRRLGNTRMDLQENKAVNLALAAPCVSGILIRPGESFSFWSLVGNPTAARGFRTGLTVSSGETGEGVGGGLCQFTNLIHWMVLHTPLTVVEHHHHDGVDLFPDFNRQVPFGTGTSIFYNYLDYRFRNDTDRVFQIVVYVTDTYLCGEIRSTSPLPVKYHIVAEGERFVRRGGEVYRRGQVFRTCIDKRTGDILSRELLRDNNARVLYDTTHLEVVDETVDYTPPCAVGN